MRDEERERVLAEVARLSSDVQRWAEEWGSPRTVDIEGGLPGGGQLRGCSRGDYKKIIHGGVPG